jgi:hypothetical protein
MRLVSIWSLRMFGEPFALMPLCGSREAPKCITGLVRTTAGLVTLFGAPCVTIATKVALRARTLT